eukprot:scpid86500/ scgid8643/ Vesicle-associated membrane protein 8
MANSGRYGDDVRRPDRLKGDDRLDEVKGQVTEVTGLLHVALEKSIQRGENLDRLDRRAENLAAESRHFKNSSKKLASHMWWQNRRWQIVLILTIILVLGGVGFILYWKYGRKK